MTLEEFNKTIDEMERFYEKNVIDEQRQVWYKELKNMDIKRFKYIVGQVYRTQEFLPRLSKILEINSNLGYSQQQKEAKDNSDCKKCGGSGYVQYKKIIKNGDKDLVYTYGAVCSCHKEYPYDGRRLTDERHRSNYYIPYAEQIGV